jgi:hypothetical protein
MGYVMEKDVIVYEIDPSKKYMLSFPELLSLQQRVVIQKRLQEWIKSDATFCIVPPGVKLVRVDLPDVLSSDLPKPKRHLVVAANHIVAREFAKQRRWKRKEWMYAGIPDLLHGLSGWIVYTLPGYQQNRYWKEIEGIIDGDLAWGYVEESPEFSRSKAMGNQ